MRLNSCKADSPAVTTVDLNYSRPRPLDTIFSFEDRLSWLCAQCPEAGMPIFRTQALQGWSQRAVRTFCYNLINTKHSLGGYIINS